MTKTEIVEEIAKLPQPERRQILNDILGMEPDAQVYEELTRSADEAFAALDESEQHDAAAS